MITSRDARFLFLGFLTCFALGVFMLKVVLVTHRQAPSTGGQPETRSPMTVEEYIPESRKEALRMGSLPAEVSQHQTLRFKRVGLTMYALVYGNQMDSGKNTFLGALRLDEEKKQWHKFIELKTNFGSFSVHDIWHEDGADIQHPRIYLSIASSAYGGDVFFHDLKQREIGKNTWKILRCYYGATDLGNQTEYTLDTGGEWRAYTFETKDRLTPDGAIITSNAGCGLIPEIKMYNE